MNLSFPTLAISVFILWLFAKGQAASYWKLASSIGWDVSVPELLPFVSGGKIQIQSSSSSSTSSLGGIGGAGGGGAGGASDLLGAAETYGPMLLAA